MLVFSSAASSAWRVSAGACSFSCRSVINISAPSSTVSHQRPAFLAAVPQSWMIPERLKVTVGARGPFLPLPLPPGHGPRGREPPTNAANIWPRSSPWPRDSNRNKTLNWNQNEDERRASLAPVPHRHPREDCAHCYHALNLVVFLSTVTGRAEQDE